MYDHRLDYVKASMSLHTENAGIMATQWYNVFEGLDRDGDAPRSAHVNSVRNNPDGTRLFVFEAWGPACINAHLLDFATWGPHLDRLDVRVDTEVTRNGVDRLYDYIKSNKHGNRNVTLYDSKPRSKRSGRDSGGFGIALGSHKSDLRITWYVRGTAQGAMEFQCAGVKLQNTVKVYVDMLSNLKVIDNEQAWMYCQAGLYAMGVMDISQTIGLDTYNLAMLLRDEAPVESEIEQKLAALDAMLDGLPPDALQAHLTSVQMRLF
jgi:hypothetical protein